MWCYLTPTLILIKEIFEFRLQYSVFIYWKYSLNKKTVLARSVLYLWVIFVIITQATKSTLILVDYINSSKWNISYFISAINLRFFVFVLSGAFPIIFDIVGQFNFFIPWRRRHKEEKENCDFLIQTYLKTRPIRNRY